jgi:uncharacterized protein
VTVPRLLGAVGGAGLAAAGYATFVEPRWYALRHATVPVLRPSAVGGLRVLHLSDLHLQPEHRALRRFLEACAAQAPDMVVVTGDILGHVRSVQPAVALLDDVRGDAIGVFVLGSNDRFAPVAKNPLRYFDKRRTLRPEGEPLDTGALVRGLTDRGWSIAENRRFLLETPAGTVDVIGQGDAHLGSDRPSAVDWTPPDGDVALGLGIAHAPYRRVLDRMDRAGLDLALAGHTHGGQLRVPGWGALVDNCDLPLRQARGLSGYGAGLALHVSAGLGASRYTPFRFACRPEATLLDLVPRHASEAAL